MSLILRRSLIFLVLLVSGLILYAVWFDIKARRYDDTAIPYLETSIPRLASWQYKQLEPFLSPKAKMDFKNESLQEAYQRFQRLGQFQSMERPSYTKSYGATSELTGDVEVAEYQVLTHFDSGPAIIKVTLLVKSDSYYIEYFGVHSDIFTESTQID